MVNEQADNQIQRGVPNQPEERVAFIKNWHKLIKDAKETFFKRQFKGMLDDQQFVRGYQWGNTSSVIKDDRYICNLVHRHIQKRTAALYAKNPRAIAKRKKRLDYAIWDEKPESLMMAQEMPDDPIMNMMLQDFHQGTIRRLQFDSVAKTLELLYDYYMNEARPRFKLQIKQLVRRTLTCGVGYLKISFQRDMSPNPDQLTRVRDFTARLENLEMLAADLADGEIDPGQKEMEELRLNIESVMAEEQMIIREGLMFDFPKATSIIPDPNTIQLKGFLGAGWIAQEYYLSKDEIKKLFKIDIGTNYNGYHENISKAMTYVMSQNAKNKGLARVWEVYHLDLGNKYYLCDGYENFLKDDFTPELTFEQGHPFHVLTFNDLEDEKNIIPPSDTSLMMDQQKEYNRAREALREHRIASRPAWITPKGMFGESDQLKLGNHLAHELLQLNIPVTQNLDIKKLLIAKPVAAIDPAVYDVEYLFTDVLRATGEHEATFGGGSGDTATEVSVAEQARVSSVESNIDDMDDFMTDVAKDAGQILLLNMSVETVKKIVGPGATWPQYSAQEAADEIILEIQAGSSGRPNKAQELANAERIMPYLVQIPGINPRWLAEQMLTRMDDKMDLNEAFIEGMPSITALNAMAKMQNQAGGGAPGQGSGSGNTAGTTNQPADQGGQGGNNTENPQQTAPGSQPAYPATN